MKFKCDCGQTLNASTALIGEMISCPECQASIRVPDPDELAAKAEAVQLAKAQRKKQRERKEKAARATGFAAFFSQVGDAVTESLDANRTWLIRSAGFVCGPLLLLVASAFYFKPIAITEERVQKIERGMTLKQVEAILGTKHRRYRDPRPKEVFIWDTLALVDYSWNRRPYDDHQLHFNARLWHDGWFVTGNNATRSVFVDFENDVVKDVIWKELVGEEADTRYPYTAPGEMRIIRQKGGNLLFIPGKPAKPAKPGK